VEQNGLEGKREEEERLSIERMRRMKSLMLDMISKIDCDDVPLSESGGEEMAEDDCASIMSTDVHIVPVGDDNIRYNRYSISVGELDTIIIRGEEVRTIFGGGEEVLTENVQLIIGGTQDQNQHTQYMDNTRNISLAELAPVFSVGRTEVRRGDRGLETEMSGTLIEVD
jgi:hypothetical protein